MITITTTEDLAAFCDRAASVPYVTVDTEFLRERTYYSKTLPDPDGDPGRGAMDTAALIDPLVSGLSLDPLYALFRNPKSHQGLSCRAAGSRDILV